MSDHAVRVLETTEHRAASVLFRTTLHAKSGTDEEWARGSRTYQPGSTWGVFDPELIGTARSFDEELTVPGAGRIPLAAVTGVGVRADRTRRGVLTELMRTQLTELAERGTTAAALYPTESPIYGRFGYGASTVAKSYTVDRRAARLRPEVPAGGEISLLDLEETVRRYPEVYAGVAGDRPGRLARSPYWWAVADIHLNRNTDLVRSALHHGPDGVDGLVTYSVKHSGRGHDEKLAAEIIALHAATPSAFAGLWRHLLGLDLIDTVTAHLRPADEPVELLLTDPRHCRIGTTEDELWLRLIDVPAALAARTYTGGEVVIDVVDPLLPANSGRYRVSADGAAPTEAAADLRLGVDTLAMLYLGTWSASSLAGAGRIEELSPSALAGADALFGTRVSSWCGTFF
jgi:predicted acetyltransferase